MHRWKIISKIYLLELSQSLKLALPIMLGQLSYMVVQLTDNVMVGHVGRNSLAASSFVNSIFSFFLVFGISTLNFTSTTVSRSFGARRYEECGEAWRSSLIIALCLAIIAIFLLVNMHSYLNLFGQTEEVVREAGPYFLWIGFSTLPLFLFHSSKQFSESVGITWIPLRIQIITIFNNIFFNWLFIFGHWGFPKMGLAGAGLSTLLARTIALAILLTTIYRSSQYRHFIQFNWLKSLHQDLIKRSIKLGIPAGLQGLFEMGVFALAGIMMGWISPVYLAAHQIALSLAAATFMVMLGLSFAANIRVGYAVGRGNLRSAKRVGFGIFWFAVLFMTIMAFLFVLLRHDLPALFIPGDEEVLAIAAQLLIVAAIFQIFDGLQVCAIGALRGLEDVFIPTIVTFISYWLIGYPLCYLMGFTLKMEGLGIWIGLATSLAVAATFLTTRFWYLTRETH